MDRTLLLGVIFLLVAVPAGLLVRTLMPRRTGVERLQQEAAPAGESQKWAPRIAEWLKPAARLAQPKEDALKSRMRRRLINAGFRSEDAPTIFFGAKVALAVALPLLAFFFAVGDFREQLPLLLGLTAAMGYFAPNVFLILRIRKRKREIFEAFPDALDLMVVCVEAGLGLDAAIAKVGEEIGKTSSALGDEFRLVNLELRAGLTRDQALRNLALRTGVEDIDALVAMLIQADKFGTSIADSLRVHADGMRTKRMLRAEEAAQKLPVKLVFPVVALIFPALFLVLLGPSILSLARILGPIMSGH